MPVRRQSLSPGRGPRMQRGAAFLILVFMIGIAGTALILSAGATTNVKLAEAQRTSKALATARDALMGFAVGESDLRPGNLPCPATDYATGIAANTCSTSASRLGYLPWNSLGLNQLRDGSGAPLLYAVSSVFRKANPSPGTLNSDTAGDFTVAGDNAIAVVFAPGVPMGSQNRNAGTFNVANFLELRNADGDSVFENSAESSTFNDRLLWITPAAFFPPLELRAMRLAKQYLEDYVRVTKRYPKSNAYRDDFNCWTYGGRLPYERTGNPCLLGGDGATIYRWTMIWPGWFFDNYWDYVIHYAVAPPCTEVGSVNCNGSGSFLTLDGTDNFRVLLFRQGIPNGQSRPCSSPSQCLDDAGNQDSAPPDRNYVTPSSGNDRLTVVAP